ncbi:helix-turn-helix domain-containing protein [Candidatus Woesearchaeota archaeon]|nr:helix-turn-helix domain-containing protein [Candidatus Woesearchaeota archaeon]
MEEIIQKLGFTQAEARVYITLLRLGPVKVGKVIEKTGLQSSTVHNVLHSLIDKGIITYILKGKMKIYQAVDPNLILKSYKEKEQEFEKIIPKLESLQKLAEIKQEAEIYEGTKGIMTMLNELIEDAKPNDTYYFFAVDVRGLNKDIQKFFERFDAKRKAKKLITRGLARKELKPLFEKRKYLKMKYTNMPLPANTGICNNKMALISWGEKPTGILIQSKQIVKKQKEFFNELWNKIEENNKNYL